MPNNHHKEDKLLTSLDGAQRASVPDFFYAKLRARMEKEVDAEKTPTFLLRPAVWAVSLAILLAANLFTMAGFREQGGVTANESKPGSVEQVTTEYNLQAGDLYQ